MGLITYKPTTPSYRKTVKIDKSQLFKGRPDKSLIEDLQPNSGRNNTGKITIRHRSGGHKKKYRLVNFKRNTFDKIGTVERIEYDPNRSAFIALINYQDIKEYIIAPTDLKNGDSRGDEEVWATGGLSAVAGYPHITIPLDLVNGFPVGVSFLASAWEEAKLINMAYSFEDQNSFYPRPKNTN